MKTKKNNQMDLATEITENLSQEAKNIALLSRSGGMITREMIKKAEEILANPNNQKQNGESN